MVVELPGPCLLAAFPWLLCSTVCLFRNYSFTQDLSFFPFEKLSSSIYGNTLVLSVTSHVEIIVVGVPAHGRRVGGLELDGL